MATGHLATYHCNRGFYMHTKLPRSDQDFSYYLPDEELRPFIAYYSVQHRFFPVIAPRFIPDLGGSIIASYKTNALDIAVWGPFNELTTIEGNSAETLARYFIEFQPGGLSRLICLHSNEILNRKILLSDIDQCVYRSLRQIYEKHTCTDELISLLDNYFLKLLEWRKDVFASGRHILNLLYGLNENISMKNLSLETHYSTRQINRYINSLAGVSGKGYIKIKRFNKAVETLKKSERSIEEIAFILGYYDASHFVHDFTELCGLSPALYRKNMSGFYNETLKKF
jgi:AraC-like DNA-binding protein